jgi:hypothetical protein
VSTAAFTFSDYWKIQLFSKMQNFPDPLESSSAHQNISKRRNSMTTRIRVALVAVSVLVVVLILLNLFPLSLKYHQVMSLTSSMIRKQLNTTNTPSLNNIAHDGSSNVAPTKASSVSIRTLAPTKAPTKLPTTLTPTSTVGHIDTNKISLYIDMRLPGGLGNKLQGLIGLLALARSAGRHRVGLSGPSVIWRDFWEPAHPWISYQNPPHGGTNIKWCTVKDLMKLGSDCRRVFWHEPERILILNTKNSNYGEPPLAQGANLTFFKAHF